LAGVDRPAVIRSFSLAAPPAAKPAPAAPKPTAAPQADPAREAEEAKAKAAEVAKSMSLPDPASFAHTLAPYLPKMTGEPEEEVADPVSDKKRAGDRVAIVAKSGEQSYSTSGQVTARLVEGAINGHYHEKVNVIGGGQNCYWARQIAEDKVQLEILSQKGRTTGMVAKAVSLERFMYTFYLCKDDRCPILIRQA
ncbi:MAG: hypothetical protein HQK87_09135, partial [Nitrospinae bacterium]|nr:hypothetical protein [Nitrospinota bacterium]